MLFNPHEIIVIYRIAAQMGKTVQFGHKINYPYQKNNYNRPLIPEKFKGKHTLI